MTTTPENWETIKTLFEEALDLDSSDRSAFLLERCLDPAMRNEVERLLAEHEQAGTFLSTPVLGNISLESPASDNRFSRGDHLAGRFRIVRYIAGGGMGEVYEAEDLELREHVAVKMIRPEILRQPGAVGRFKREVHLARKVTHPNVCRIFDLFRHKPEGSLEETVFVSMELLHGRTLSTCLKEDGRMSLAAALPLARQMASALAAAHAAGIVHRDFKPGNVVLVPPASGSGVPRVVITDFGLALQSAGPVDASSFTTGGVFLGTPAYMAPEQVEGKPTTAATDIYALGLVMFEMVTGVRPFRGETPISSAVKRLSEAPPPPRRIEPGVSPWLESVILRCLDRDPAKRFPDAESLLQSLQPPSSRDASPSVLRHPVAILFACLLLAVALTVAYRYRAHRQLTQQATTQISPRRSVAVLGFKNLSGKPELSWISTALSEELTAELGAGEKLRTVPGETVARVKTDMSLADTDSLSRDTLGKLRQRLGTDVVVLGSYLDVGNRLRVDLQVQDANEGQTVATISDTDGDTQILDLVTRIGNRLREDCGGGEITSEQAQAVKASQPSTAEASRLYAEGLASMRVFDALAARKLLDQAAAQDPDNALIHSALASAWTQLGYDQNARSENQRAFDLSSHLPREERLAIEGGYRSATKDWDKAIDVYRTLSTFFPDNLEYGLDLAAAQMAGGKNKEALQTLDTLSELPSPAKDDPRIDLSEARAYGAISDFKNSLAAANRVTTKASASGSRLLAARGQRARGFALQSLGQLNDALTALDSAAELYGQAGDRDGIAQTLGLVGNTRSDQGNLIESEAAYRKGLAIVREIGDQRTTANMIINLANLTADQGNFTSAEEQYNQALAIYQDIHEAHNEASTRFNLATLYYQEGKYKLASTEFDGSLKAFRDLGIKAGTQRTLCNYGELLYREGQVDRSRSDYEEGLNLAKEIGYKRGMGFCTSGLGDLLLAQADFPAAEKMSDEVLKIGTELGDKVRIAHAHMLRAETLMEEGRPADAENLIHDAAKEFGPENEDDPGTNILLAMCLIEEGKLEQASATIAEIKKTETKISDPLVIWQIRTVDARIAAATDTPAATRELNRVIAESKAEGDVVTQFEARLYLGEIETKFRPAAGRTFLAQLEHDARAKGFILLANKAQHARLS